MASQKRTTEYYLMLNVDKLKKTMEAMELTWKELATRLGRSENTLRSYVSNPSHVRLDQIAEIVTALNDPKLEPEELIVQIKKRGA